MKKFTAAVMALVLLFALCISAGAKSASFPDITDPALLRDVAVLQMLGVVSGDDNGNFMPNGTLTRAAFCKMAVTVMGRGDEESIYRSRTIFPDVRAGYWAAGYINLAVSGDKKIILGNSDGTFRPDDPVTVAQAITILMRVLGYADADAGMLWPDGYITLAKDAGLLEGIGVSSPGSSMTRAQAAHLFANLLGTNVKGAGSYISTLGTATPDAVIMQLNVSAQDGSAGAVRTSDGILKTANGVLPPAILGLRGTLLKDSLGRLLTFLPESNRQQDVTVQTVDAGWLKDMSGATYTIPATAAAYTATEVTTYVKAFMDIAAGMHVTLYYSADGKIDGVYINTSKTESAVVVGSTGSVGALTGGDTGYTVIRNGAPASSSDIRPYDVATYDASAKILYVSDFRLSGCYENAWPSLSSPSKLTLMGHEFPVLPSAAATLAGYKLGQTITLLFTSDLQVAGAVTSGVSGSTAVGVVQSGATGSSASVKLFNGLVLSGDPSMADSAAAQLSGELVTVFSAGAGKISMSRMYSSGVAGSLDLTKKTVGAVALSPAVKVYERVGTGPVAQISLNDLVQTTISASKILYAGTDATSRVDTLLLDDVTGDRYTYGILKADTTTESSGGFDATNRTVSVTNSDNKTGTAAVVTGLAITNGAPGGVAFSADGAAVVNIVTLTAIKNVSRSAFYTRNDVTYLTVNGAEFPVAANVECYNSMGKTWFESLTDARAFSATLTVYYDRAAAEGGKIRMVIVE
ncbi:S-layer homology domain-containing protein [Sporobacter termitidis DSM 10068]|uniref:S-layer homology domain-containing protein n=1 Tax=Sporobacter termitidis DSM 10068 TaxID=1123282 RepID=A0A1M5YY95_9FIRM|nr:S-layer homology domain-containing protein [Sporobacter termitidis]SHI16493.1 S-layer homology domain-containing protein [Sporobacter termitidis DSM 10068]